MGSNPKTPSDEYTGKFCWEEIDRIAVPFIIRPSREILAEVGMLKKTLYKDLLSVVNEAVFFLACPAGPSQFPLKFSVSTAELNLLNEINTIHCDSYFSKHPYVPSNTFLIKKDDAIELKNILTTFRDMALVDKKVSCRRYGYLQVKGRKTPIPFVDVNGMGLVVPLFLFDCKAVKNIHRENIDYWSLVRLKILCRIVNFPKSYYDRGGTELHPPVVKMSNLVEGIPATKIYRIFRNLPSSADLSKLLSVKARFRTINSNETQTARSKRAVIRREEREKVLVKEPKTENNHVKNLDEGFRLINMEAKLESAAKTDDTLIQYPKNETLEEGIITIDSDEEPSVRVNRRKRTKKLKSKSDDARKLCNTATLRRILPSASISSSSSSLSSIASRAPVSSSTIDSDEAPTIKQPKRITPKRVACNTELRHPSSTATLRPILPFVPISSASSSSSSIAPQAPATPSNVDSDENPSVGVKRTKTMASRIGECNSEDLKPSNTVTLRSILPSVPISSASSSSSPIVSQTPATASTAGLFVQNPTLFGNNIFQQNPLSNATTISPSMFLTNSTQGGVLMSPMGLPMGMTMTSSGVDQQQNLVNQAPPNFQISNSVVYIQQAPSIIAPQQQVPLVSTTSMLGNLIQQPTYQLPSTQPMISLPGGVLMQPQVNQMQFTTNQIANPFPAVPVTESGSITLPANQDACPTTIKNLPKNQSWAILGDSDMPMISTNVHDKLFIKVVKIPQHINATHSLGYVVKKVKIRPSNHIFLVISKTPYNDDNFLINLGEAKKYLFPDKSRKVLVKNAVRLKLEIFALNATQSAALASFYNSEKLVMERAVKENLYFDLRIFQEVLPVLRIKCGLS
ncbi:uncharacterized protein [Euwallacea fornicatus]|uniref:uncharacterized protein n=1 Tax=Euwallacea fornicatus TaxID=995702 RepID=UPI0033904B9F